MMRKLALVILCSLFLSTLSFAQEISIGRLNVEEEDGSPSTFPYKLKVTNGTLTDNADGTASLTTGGGAGGAPTDADYLVGTANGSLSAEIVVGTSPGGELGGTWASPTIDDGISVTNWNLTTPTLGVADATSINATGIVTGSVLYGTTALQLGSTYYTSLVGSETDPSALKTAGTDNVKDTHIDWGSGANQVDLADIPGGTAGAYTFNFASATTQLTTVTGVVVIPAGAGVNAGSANYLEVPNGANPTVDIPGQITVDTSVTSGCALRFYGDALYSLPGWKSKAFVILDPAATDDVPIWKVPYDITIKQIHVQCTGGTNIIGGLDEYNSAGATIVAAVDSDITATAGGSVNDDGTLTNPGIAKANYLFWHTTSISGTPTSVTVSFEYTIDAVN